MPVRVLAATVVLLVQLLALAALPVSADDSVAGTPDVTITIGSGLSDRDVRVRAGSIIRFVNRDDDEHRMRSRTGRGFDTGNLEPGESFQIRLPTPGTYVYVDHREDDDARYHGRIRVVASGSGGGSTGGGSTGGGATGGTTNGGGTGGATNGGATNGTGGGTARSMATVSIGDGFFQPATTTIAVGGTITFRNDDGDEHTATSTDGGGIDSGTLTSGATYRKSFQQAGSFDFLCAFHSDMRGTIRVVGQDAAGGAGSSGTVAVPDVKAATPTPAAPSGGPDPAGPGDAATVAVEIVDFEFAPPTIQVSEGATVAWSNKGVAPHTVTATDGSFDSGMLETGGTFEQTFATLGSFDYLCSLHPQMIGTVQVTARDEVASVGASEAPGQVAPSPSIAAAAAASPPPEAPAGESVAVARTAGLDAAPLGGIALAVILVSAAVGAFAKLVASTARPPEA